jgi:hypothetical protein
MVDKLDVLDNSSVNGFEENIVRLRQIVSRIPVYN